MNKKRTETGGEGNGDRLSNGAPSGSIVWHVDSGNSTILPQILGKGPFFFPLPSLPHPFLSAISKSGFHYNLST